MKQLGKSRDEAEKKGERRNAKIESRLPGNNFIEMRLLK